MEFAINDASPRRLPNEIMAFINGFIARGGPEPHEYGDVMTWIEQLGDHIVNGVLSRADCLKIAEATVGRHLAGTLWHSVLSKPHGYHGDFETIDGIYTHRVCDREIGRRWDDFFHSQAAPRAVRNRKGYFHDLLMQRSSTQRNGPLHVLNVGSGPGRDIREWFDHHGQNGVRFDCVELDAKAIAYASKLLGTSAVTVCFYQANALRFHASKSYDLVWSAGLFDYLSDSLFVRLLRRLLRFCHRGGEVVVGNFGDYNPTRTYMEIFGGWELQHRSADRLIALALEAGSAPEAIRIGVEPEGVNLFLHIRA